MTCPSSPSGTDTVVTSRPNRSNSREACSAGDSAGPGPPTSTARFKYGAPTAPSGLPPFDGLLLLLPTPLTLLVLVVVVGAFLLVSSPVSRQSARMVPKSRALMGFARVCVPSPKVTYGSPLQTRPTWNDIHRIRKRAVKGA